MSNLNAEIDDNGVRTLIAINGTDGLSVDRINATNHALCVTDGTSLIGGTSVTPLSIKGGVVRVIDSATGDIARTTGGGIENFPLYGWYFIATADNVSAKFDSTVTRTGRLTLSIEATNTTGRGRAFQGDSYSFGGVKPNTKYHFECYAKTNNVGANGVFIEVTEYTAQKGSFVKTDTTNKFSGTNDWSKLEVTFTTGATTNAVYIYCIDDVAGTINKANFDVNSMSLSEVSSITNPSATPALLYPKATAVKSTDNVDQSQVSTGGAVGVGDNVVGGHVKVGQKFTATKKNLTGVTVQRSTSVGSPTGNITISIQADSSGSPSGTDLIAKTIPNATWLAITQDTDSQQLFSSTLVVTVGNSYWIVFSSSTQDNSNYTQIVRDSGASTGRKNYDGTTWNTATGGVYYKELYSKNTTNLTVSTDTQSLSVTAPTTDGWADGTVIDTATIAGITPLTLAPGVNNIYVSSNGPATADGTVDPSLQMTLSGNIVTPLVLSSNAQHDDNFGPTLLAVSSADGKTPVPLYTDGNNNLLINSQ